MNTNKVLPINDLKAFGIYKDGQFTIPEDQVKALKSGHMTDVVELKNLKTKTMFIDSLPARLSIVKGEDGNPSLRVDPVYREPNSHPRLNEQEKEQLIKGEIPNIKKNFTDRDGNIQTEIIEYDQKTNQFLSFDPRKVKAPEEINGQQLTPEQKRKFKEGEIVELPDQTEIQISTSEKKGLRSNRAGLVASVLLDGGLSYLLITGIKQLMGKTSEQEAYKAGKEQGYSEALVKVQKQIERRIALFPNDKDAVNDLSNAKAELSRVGSNAPNYTTSNAKQLNSIDTDEAELKNERKGRSI